jgi:hypothetical protein
MTRRPSEARLHLWVKSLTVVNNYFSCVDMTWLEIRSWLTSIQHLLCWRGLRKKVPSNRGYRSNTNIGDSQSTQATRDVCSAANVDSMKQRVSSLPWLPSSSICKTQTAAHSVKTKLCTFAVSVRKLQNLYKAQLGLNKTSIGSR